MKENYELAHLLPVLNKAKRMKGTVMIVEAILVIYLL